ncbi:hypothetical protein [Catenulispora subtropica]|uniref:Uncharacterized protein n=1 Tax=Catenulispora subtropica TaxID=450798 RepID=A0ABP5DAE1_9ACTN
MAAAPPPADAWPFLIARGRTVGQRVILAPEFLVSTGRHVDLQPTVARPDGSPESASADGLSRSRFEDSGTEYTLFFRRTIATADLIGRQGGDLRDESSRRVEVTEGVMIAGSPEGVDRRLLDDALKITKKTFRAFWLADDRNARPVLAPRLAQGEPAPVDLSDFVRRDRTERHFAPPPRPPAEGVAAPRGRRAGPGGLGDLRSPAPSPSRSPWQLAAVVVLIVLIAVLVLALASG